VLICLAALHMLRCLLCHIDSRAGAGGSRFHTTLYTTQTRHPWAMETCEEAVIFGAQSCRSYYR